MNSRSFRRRQRSKHSGWPHKLWQSLHGPIHAAFPPVNCTDARGPGASRSSRCYLCWVRFAAISATKVMWSPTSCAGLRPSAPGRTSTELGPTGGRCDTREHRSTRKDHSSSCCTNHFGVVLSGVHVVAVFTCRMQPTALLCTSYRLQDSESVKTLEHGTPWRCG